MNASRTNSSIATISNTKIITNAVTMMTIRPKPNEAGLSTSRSASAKSLAPYATVSSIHTVIASASASPIVVTNNNPVNMNNALGKCCITARASSVPSRLQIASAIANATASINSIDANLTTIANGPPANQDAYRSGVVVVSMNVHTIANSQPTPPRSRLAIISKISLAAFVATEFAMLNGMRIRSNGFGKPGIMNAPSPV